MTIYSDADLHLNGPTVEVARLPVDTIDEDDSNRVTFRYSGLRLMIYSNERWFLLADQTADATTPPTFIVRDVPGLRVDLRAPNG